MSEYRDFLVKNKFLWYMKVPRGLTFLTKHCVTTEYYDNTQGKQKKNNT